MRNESGRRDYTTFCKFKKMIKSISCEKQWMICKSICNSSVAFHYQSYYFDFMKTYKMFSAFSTSLLNFHEIFYCLKNSNTLVDEFSSIPFYFWRLETAYLTFSYNFWHYLFYLFLFIYTSSFVTYQNFLRTFSVN